jgi:hypothetical protein
MTEQKLLDMTWIVGPSTGIGQRMGVPNQDLQAEIDTLEAAAAAKLAALRPVEDGGPHVVYAKCTPGRGGCSGFGG